MATEKEYCEEAARTWLGRGPVRGPSNVAISTVADLIARERAAARAALVDLATTTKTTTKGEP